MIGVQQKAYHSENLQFLCEVHGMYSTPVNYDIMADHRSDVVEIIAIITKKMWRCKPFINLFLARNLSARVTHQQQGISRIMLCSVNNEFQNIGAGCWHHIWHQSTSDKMGDATSSENDSSHEKPNEGWQWWWAKMKDILLVASAILGATSFVFQLKYAAMEAELAHVTNQIQDLYGPLYWNRLLQEKKYNAAMKGRASLTEYLKTALVDKNKDDIRWWRSYVYNSLYPLDKEAESIIRQNAHLISNSEYLDEFEEFLTHLARLQLIMKTWKKEDGTLKSDDEFEDDDYLEETNALEWKEVMNVLNHVTDKYKEKTKEQKEKQKNIHGLKIYNALLK